ncbi:hypothetical protein BZA05DRAFT_411899 [Tricharina praecox]|uniref:uncharacterized protein n=1 Tax=Tricharina praecox TaxID=43433 RepID=UPI00221F6CE2|nr:uncharacterized protein BZA05DRAFT_411899 [Tricharina praecox]KAI5842682.1 hypothetical protein BZA05DRAFT_411899 [Tricharina praecox]
MGFTTHLYALCIINAVLATLTIFSPVCLFTLPPVPQLAELTGLKMPWPSHSHEIGLGLTMYMLVVFYWWGATNRIRSVRTCALVGMMIYADGSLLTCLLVPDIEGGVVFLITAVLYLLLCGWMLMEGGVADEVKEFVTGGMREVKRH